jgi:hypothetical protein
VKLSSEKFPESEYEVGKPESLEILPFEIGDLPVNEAGPLLERAASRIEIVRPKSEFWEGMIENLRGAASYLEAEKTRIASKTFRAIAGASLVSSMVAACAKPPETPSYMPPTEAVATETSLPPTETTTPEIIEVSAEVKEGDPSIFEGQGEVLSDVQVDFGEGRIISLAKAEKPKDISSRELWESETASILGVLQLVPELADVKREENGNLVIVVKEGGEWYVPFTGSTELQEGLGINFKVEKAFGEYGFRLRNSAQWDWDENLREIAIDPTEGNIAVFFFDGSKHPNSPGRTFSEKLVGRLPADKEFQVQIEVEGEKTTLVFLDSDGGAIGKVDVPVNMFPQNKVHVLFAGSPGSEVTLSKLEFVRPGREQYEYLFGMRVNGEWEITKVRVDEEGNWYTPPFDEEEGFLQGAPQSEWRTVLSGEGRVYYYSPGASLASDINREDLEMALKFDNLEGPDGFIREIMGSGVIEADENFFTIRDPDGVEVLVDMPQSSEVLRKIIGNEIVWDWSLRGFTRTTESGELQVLRTRYRPEGAKYQVWVRVTDTMELEGFGTFSIEQDLDLPGGEALFNNSRASLDAWVRGINYLFGDKPTLQHVEVPDYQELKASLALPELPQEIINTKAGVTIEVVSGRNKSMAFLPDNTIGLSWKTRVEAGRIVITIFQADSIHDGTHKILTTLVVDLLQWISKGPDLAEINLMVKDNMDPRYSSLVGERNGISDARENFFNMKLVPGIGYLGSPEPLLFRTDKLSGDKW